MGDIFEDESNKNKYLDLTYNLGYFLLSTLNPLPKTVDPLVIFNVYSTIYCANSIFLIAKSGY